MALFLATLYSPLSKCGAIGIIDSKDGLLYLQMEQPPNSVITSQLRSVTFYKNEIYISTPAAILVYSIELTENRPLFKLTSVIVLHEWILGSLYQAKLYGIFISSARKQLFIANNRFNSIDELTFSGQLKKRHYLHEIAPELFVLPKTVDKQFNYGHVRHIGETPSGEIFLTISGLNGAPNTGCVINFDTGEVLLDNLETPVGGVFSGESFFIQNNSQGVLSAHTVTSENTIGNVVWQVEPMKGRAECPAPIRQNMQGMVQIEDSIFCGVDCFGKATNQRMPPRIVSFDMKTGRQKNAEILFPDLNGFRQPRVFSLSSLPLDLKHLVPKDFTFFVNGNLKQNAPFSTKQKKNDVVTLEGKQELSGKGVQSISKNDERAKVVSFGQPAVVLDKVNLFYNRSATSLLSFKKNIKERREYQALCDVSFTLYEGETVGIIGRNGSGKSTISMVISGALAPDKGTVTTNGLVQLLSIGLGFRKELTGRENVLINGALLGLSKKEILRFLPDIENFAELEEFMDEPVRTYSAGMRSRLGFAVATVVSPDILILDEVMSTGDAAFRKKADERMQTMRERTKTIIIVSHSINQVRMMCSRVIWLNKGKVIMDGKPDDVLSSYSDYCKNPGQWLTSQGIM